MQDHVFTEQEPSLLGPEGQCCEQVKRGQCVGGGVLGRARARVIKTATTACSALAMRLGEKTGEYCPAFWILKKSYKVS